MIMLDAKVVLVLAPHTDDGEFGCGGTIAKLVESGSRVVYVAFSAAEQSVPPNLPRDILRTEVKAATRELGIEPDDCIVLRHEVRKFPEDRQKILEDMIRLGGEYRPDLVLLPSIHDTHQDHLVVAQEGFRAFKRTTMLGYEVPWNNLDFRTSCFVSLSDKQVSQKILAVKKYESQHGRTYSDPEFIRALAVTRGVQVGAKYAETFEVMRWIIK
jgi:LmbE family N-acetylglucosaminyl deacetylase